MFNSGYEYNPIFIGDIWRNRKVYRSIARKVLSPDCFTLSHKVLRFRSQWRRKRALTLKKTCYCEEIRRSNLCFFGFPFIITVKNIFLLKLDHYNSKYFLYKSSQLGFKDSIKAIFLICCLLLFVFLQRLLPRYLKRKNNKSIYRFCICW